MSRIRSEKTLTTREHKLQPTGIPVHNRVLVEPYDGCNQRQRRKRLRQVPRLRHP